MTSADAVATDIVDEATQAAAGTRTAARWMASGLGGIPSLAILGAVVRAPGTAGFDPVGFAFGVGLAALGAVIGVLAFARVIAPVPLEDRHLSGFDLTRVPGHPYKVFDDLSADMNDVRSSVARKELDGARAQRAVERTKVEAQESQAAAETAAKAAAGAPPTDSAVEHANNERARAEESERRAAAAAAAATANTAELAVWEAQLSRRELIRQKAYMLKAADEVGRRFRHAQIAAVAAVALIATGVILVGLAPKPTVAPAPAPSRTPQALREVPHGNPRVPLPDRRDGRRAAAPARALPDPVESSRA